MPPNYINQEGNLNLYSQFTLNLSAQASAKENYQYRSHISEAEIKIDFILNSR